MSLGCGSVASVAGGFWHTSLPQVARNPDGNEWMFVISKQKLIAYIIYIYNKLFCVLAEGPMHARRSRWLRPPPVLAVHPITPKAGQRLVRTSPKTLVARGC